MGSLLTLTESQVEPDESELSIIQDDCHWEPSAVVAIKRTEIRQKGLPIYPHKLSLNDEFRILLHNAYVHEYGFAFGTSLHKEPLRYARKLAFYDP